MRQTFVRPLAAALAAILLPTLAGPSFAGEPARPPGNPPAKKSLSASAMAWAAAVDPAKAVSTAQAPASEEATSSPRFFKTGRGAAVLVLLAAGIGYTTYSVFHDRDPVKSPIR